jgi:ATP-dependent protease ClpP protease subunit
MNKLLYALAGDGTETLELDIYSAIAQESWWFDSVSAKQVRRKLKENAKAKTIKVRIQSDGGDTFEASAIYSLLQDHPARVEVMIDGIAASAATLVAMAGDDIAISEGGWFMIHNPWGMAIGEGEALRSWADVLDKTRDTFASVYAKRSGLAKSEILALMDAETWMTAAEAKARGFVDRVVAAKGAPAAASTKAAKAARGAMGSVAFSLASGDYENIPDVLRRQLEASRTESTDERESVPPPAPTNLGQRPEPTESHMTVNAIPKSITAALNLVEAADEASVLAELKRSQARAGLFAKIAALVGITAGQSDDEVLGTVQAWKEGAAKVPALEKAAAENKAASEKSDLDALLQKGREELKLTKAAADSLRTKVEAGFKAKAEKRDLGDDEWTLSQARAYVNALPEQPHLAGTGGGKPKAKAKTDNDPPAPEPEVNALKWEGKSYEQMTGSQQAQLEEEDPELFKQMRADWAKRGEPEFKRPAA